MSWTLDNVCNLPENFLKPICNCINPPSTIRNVASNMLSPYYCWYAPCLSPSTIKSPEIIQGQLSCNITNCSITIDEIRVNGGIITIKNACANTILRNSNVIVSLDPIVFETKLPVFDYRWMLLIMSSIMLLT